MEMKSTLPYPESSGSIGRRWPNTPGLMAKKPQPLRMWTSSGSNLNATIKLSQQRPDNYPSLSTFDWEGLIR